MVPWSVTSTLHPCTYQNLPLFSGSIVAILGMPLTTLVTRADLQMVCKQFPTAIVHLLTAVSGRSVRHGYSLSVRPRGLQPLYSSSTSLLASLASSGT